MDNSRNPILTWACYYQGENMEELRQLLLLTSLELETTRLKAEEELKIRDGQLFQLRDILNKAIEERDEVQDKCQRLLLEKLLLEQQQQQRQTAQLSGISSIEDEPRRAMDSTNGFSFSDCDESIVSSPEMDLILPPLPPPLPPPPPPQPQPPVEQEPALPIAIDKPLPEKGKLLQAVMRAGPLLENLLLAGPLPQWRHPPPPLDSYQIPPPPVVIPSPTTPTNLLLSQDPLLNNTDCHTKSGGGTTDRRKRGCGVVSDYSTEPKYKRLFFSH